MIEKYNSVMNMMQVTKYNIIKSLISLCKWSCVGLICCRLNDALVNQAAKLLTVSETVDIVSVAQLL